jgi:hypothetical protein
MLRVHVRSAVEAGEEPPERGLGDADPLIGHIDAGAVAAPCDLDIDPPARRAVLDRVLDEVLDDLLQAQLVS